MSEEEPTLSKRERTRLRLIEAATAAIGERGFEAVTLDEIAAGAGMTKGAIYDHFGSKDGLFLAVIAADHSSLPFPEVDRSAPAAERMQVFVEAILEQGDRTRQRMPIQAAFLLYSLNHPEAGEGQPERLAHGFAYERRRLLEMFGAEELAMAPERLILLLEAMIPGLMYIKSQAPGLVSNEAVTDIFMGLLAKRA